MKCIGPTIAPYDGFRFKKLWRVNQRKLNVFNAGVMPFGFFLEQMKVEHLMDDLKSPPIVPHKGPSWKKPWRANQRKLLALNAGIVPHGMFPWQFFWNVWLLINFWIVQKGGKLEELEYRLCVTFFRTCEFPRKCLLCNKNSDVCDITPGICKPFLLKSTFLAKNEIRGGNSIFVFLNLGYETGLNRMRVTFFRTFFNFLTSFPCNFFSDIR